MGKYIPLTDEQKVQRRKELMDKLEQGIAAVQTSDEFKRYLEYAGKFHTYSANNCMLIYIQRPDATHVAGFRRWLELGRHVRKGEKGIAIIAPHTYRLKSKGEGDEEEFGLGFHIEHVFDVSQTDGDPLPELDIQSVAGDDGEELWDALSRYAAASGVKLSIDEKYQQGAEEGWYKPSTQEIYVRPRDRRNMVKTLIHELAHHLDAGLKESDKTELETVAEGTAYVVATHYGLDCGEYSFKYIATWAGQEDGVKVLRRVMQRVQQNVRLLITAVDATLATTNLEPAA